MNYDSIVDEMGIIQGIYDDMDMAYKQLTRVLQDGEAAATIVFMQESLDEGLHSRVHTLQHTMARDFADESFIELVKPRTHSWAKAYYDAALQNKTAGESYITPYGAHLDDVYEALNPTLAINIKRGE